MGEDAVAQQQLRAQAELRAVEGDFTIAAMYLVVASLLEAPSGSHRAETLMERARQPMSQSRRVLTTSGHFAAHRE